MVKAHADAIVLTRAEPVTPNLTFMAKLVFYWPRRTIRYCPALLSRRFMRLSPPQDEPRRYHCDNPRDDGERDFHGASSGHVTR